MNKEALIKKIVSRLASELEAYRHAARNAHAESTHEQSKAENKYDTRALEASYLAHGQARQAADVQEALVAFENMDVRQFGESAPIRVGALVQLDQGATRTFYFIGPKAGGMEVEHEGNEVLVITPQSPLAQQLQGKKQGDLLQLSLRDSRTPHRVGGIW